jgi:hypothetical protein
MDSFERGMVNLNACVKMIYSHRRSLPDEEEPRPHPHSLRHSREFPGSRPPAALYSGLPGAYKW